MSLRFGIEFEYLIVDADGPTRGRIRDYSNLDYTWISQVLADKPGRDDPALATGDLGIKAGYWYLEGDERFHADGSFSKLEVKGVEIRTPPENDVDAALDRLFAIEQVLAARLASQQLALGIVGFNPNHAVYDFDPPLNRWEVDLRDAQRSYDGSHISTLSYGPDINLSNAAWRTRDCIDIARKLNHYAPWIVPFSFSSPFHLGQAWNGPSKRSFERAALRPAVKIFLPPALALTWRAISPLVHAARLPGEAGRIEFKAFDAFPRPELLRAGCHLLEGICLASDLHGRSESCDLSAYRSAARFGFTDESTRAKASALLHSAKQALLNHGRHGAAAALAPFEALLASRRTPADELLDAWRNDGRLYRPGGLAGIAQPLLACG